MTEPAEAPGDGIDDGLLGEVADLAPEEAVEALKERGAWQTESALRLADAALDAAEASPDRAARLLDLAKAVHTATRGGDDVAAAIDYAAARVCVQQGDLVQAESLLRAAQAGFRGAGLEQWLVRSHLGMTQVLAMQGRYIEAEESVRAAIGGMEARPERGAMPMLARAHRNLATLLLFQERHGEALAEFERAEALLHAASASESMGAVLGAERMELAHISLNRATALTFLDRPDEAEAALVSAIDLFSDAGDTINRGRSRTNLGRLFLRTGRFSAALEAFDQAASDLIGDVPLRAVPDADSLRQADELLLEHANAYLALNLLPEAGLALERCELLFRESGQPYALGHTRFAQGLLFFHAGRLDDSRQALEEAAALFERLENRFWSNRTSIAMAALANQAGDPARARAIAERLLADAETESGGPALAWDLFSLAEARLLRIRLLLHAGEIAPARTEADRLEQELGKFGAEPGQIALPHLRLRLEHARGQIESAAGDQSAAERHYSFAIELLEGQRVSLPLEELRTAFLDDKSALFGDFVVSLLEGEDRFGENAARAFNVVERARSRALLERLYASMENAGLDPEDALSERREALRRQLHWQYNEMTNRGAAPDASLRTLEANEAALQALEWRDAPALAQAQPIQAGDLQRAMAADEEALVYYAAGGKFMAFHVTRDSIFALRELCDVSEVEAAHRELQFQLGRAELGRAYWERHAARFERMLLETLGRLHDLLIAPAMERLGRGRLIVVPYGVLHLLPFHAFWDGERFLLERMEVRYAPSASIAVQCMAATDRGDAYRGFAGLAPEDTAIPQAVAEVERAMRHFALGRLFTGERATRQALREVAQQGDVLHLATHGLFRPDNSFFSALKLADGWVDVRELYRLRVAARLVVLSACESGAGAIRGGDEVVGLVRGFLVAGARRLVVSLWNVHDATAADLMDGFYGHLAGSGAEGAAKALRMTQLAAIGEGVHPYFWAPYIMVG